MKTSRYIALILLINTVLLLYYGKPIIESDGLTYYIIARSFAEDGDFNISQKNYHPDRRFFHYVLNEENQKIGVAFSGGYAILIAPFIRITRIVCSFIPYINHLSPYYDWPPFVDGLAILLANYFYLNLMMILLFIYLSRHFRPLAGFISLFAAYLGTPLIYYTYTAPGFTQFADTFAFAVFFITSFLYFEHRKDKTALLYLLFSGLFLGLSVFIRNNNFMFGIPYGIAILYQEIRDKTGFKNLLLKIIALSAGALPFGIMLLFYNYTQYGNALVSGYSLHGNFVLKSTLFYQLFHPVRGLFIYTPLALIVMGGLIFVKKQGFYRMLSIFYILSFFSLCQFFYYWRGGVSYGHRFSVHLYPIYVFALALVFSSSIRGMKKALVYALIALFTLFAFSHYNLYIYAMATKNSRSYLFRERDRFDLCDIARSAMIALDDMKEWFKVGRRGAFYYLHIYHYSPSLLFLPVSNLYNGYLSFLKDIQLNAGVDSVNIDIIIRSFNENTWHPRIFLCSYDRKKLYTDMRLILLSTPSRDIGFTRGENLLRYRIYPDSRFEIYLNGSLLQEARPVEETESWVKRAIEEENIAVVLYYASSEVKDGKTRVKKYYRNFKVFKKEGFGFLFEGNERP